MRLAILLACLATPAAAWKFSPIPVCTVTEATDAISLKMTYEPDTGIYALGLTTPAPWTPAPVFSIRFEGARGLTISTDRQSYSNGGRTLTATDTGFGNVLNGLEFNTTAIPILGPTAIPIPLDGAAPAIEAFRACIAAPTS